MTCKDLSMKRKPVPHFSEGPTRERQQHTPLTHDILTPPGAPVVARHRVRTILTPLGTRRAILEDIAEKPEAIRLRSLRRRLTALDRALSDREADMLERLTSCINSLSNVGCLNYLKSEVRSSPYGRLPFGEGKRREIAAMNHVLKGLAASDRALVLDLAARLDPGASAEKWTPDDKCITALRKAAGAIVILYDDWRGKRRTQGHSATSNA
jgi:hypothetical protein